MTSSLPTEAEYMLDPQGRRRFYGIYSAIVTSVTDTLNRNTIMVKVPGIIDDKPVPAVACLPITANAYHPDHNPHTAAQIAALLTTTATTASDPQGGSVSIPALTVVAKSGAGQLNHAHTTEHSMVQTNGFVANAPLAANDSQEASKYTAASGVTAPGTTTTGVTTPEHSFHRLLPAVGQWIWVMFEKGDHEHPVWIGVQS